MAFMILQHECAITHGPGGKEWADSTTVINHPALLTVRGLRSFCDCLRGDTCDECRDGEAVYLQIIGVFNQDLNQRCFVFWGFIAERQELLIDYTRDATSPDEGVSSCPENAQLVYGWYTPYPGQGRRRGWLAPCPEGQSLQDLFVLFFHTASLTRNLDTTRGLLDRLPDLDTLFRSMQKRTSLHLRLRDIGWNTTGDATIDIVGIENTLWGRCFTVSLRYKLADGGIFDYPDASFIVSDNGSWSAIRTRNNGCGHEFVLA